MVYPTGAERFFIAICMRDASCQAAAHNINTVEKRSLACRRARQTTKYDRLSYGNQSIFSFPLVSRAPMARGS
jgi:hypothetical protein